MSENSFSSDADAQFGDEWYQYHNTIAYYFIKCYENGIQIQVEAQKSFEPVYDYQPQLTAEEQLQSDVVFNYAAKYVMHEQEDLVEINIAPYTVGTQYEYLEDKFVGEIDFIRESCSYEQQCVQFDPYYYADLSDNVGDLQACVQDDGFQAYQEHPDDCVYDLHEEFQAFNPVYFEMYDISDPELCLFERGIMGLKTQFAAYHLSGDSMYDAALADILAEARVFTAPVEKYVVLEDEYQVINENAALPKVSEYKQEIGDTANAECGEMLHTLIIRNNKQQVQIEELLDILHNHNFKEVRYTDKSYVLYALSCYTVTFASRSQAINAYFCLSDNASTPNMIVCREYDLADISQMFVGYARTVVAKNIPPFATKNDIQHIFAAAGHIFGIKQTADRVYVFFEKADDAERAVYLFDKSAIDTAHVLSVELYPYNTFYMMLIDESSALDDVCYQLDKPNVQTQPKEPIIIYIDLDVVSDERDVYLEKDKVYKPQKKCIISLESEEARQYVYSAQVSQIQQVQQPKSYRAQSYKKPAAVKYPEKAPVIVIDDAEAPQDSKRKAAVAKPKQYEYVNRQQKQFKSKKTVPTYIFSSELSREQQTTTDVIEFAPLDVETPTARKYKVDSEAYGQLSYQMRQVLCKLESNLAVFEQINPKI